MFEQIFQSCIFIWVFYFYYQHLDGTLVHRQYHCDSGQSFKKNKIIIYNKKDSTPELFKDHSFKYFNYVQARLIIDDIKRPLHSDCNLEDLSC